MPTSPENETDLQSENERLKDELRKAREELSLREERAKGEKALRELTGGDEGLYAAAIEAAENSPELAGLPYAKRLEVSCLMLLGQEQRKLRSAPPPPFSRSNGASSGLSGQMKKPLDFDTARENAKKYYRG